MRLFAAGAIFSLFLAAQCWATVVDLRPNSDVQLLLTPFGSGIGDCLLSTTEYGCINSDVESPEDTTGITGISPTNDAAEQEHGFQDAPGDFGSTNSLTLKVRAAYLTTDTGEDDILVWLEVSGVLSGATKRISEVGTPDCAIADTTLVNCSLTDSAWDSLSGSDITNLTVVITVGTNNVGMPDTTTFQVTEVELVLDYNEPVAGRPVRGPWVMQ